MANVTPTTSCHANQLFIILFQTPTTTNLAQLRIVMRSWWEEEELKPGRLSDEEGKGDEATVLFGRRWKGRGSWYSAPAPRGGIAVAADGRRPFHFRHSWVKARRGLPRDRADRVYVGAGLGAKAREGTGALYDRRARSWYLPEGASPAVVRKLRQATGDAQARFALGRRAAVDFQRYIERMDGVDDELAVDAAGPISLGSLGATPADRLGFWRALADHEGPGRRLQARIVMELPEELDPAAMRRVLAAFNRELEARGLPHHGVVHRPPGGAGRNWHVHVVYSDRPAVRDDDGGWSFAARKDRDAGGPRWIRRLRQVWAEAANAELERAGARVRFHPGGYRTLGIIKAPGEHLGPRRSALERQGLPTAAGIRNAMRERAWRRAEVVARTVRRLSLARAVTERFDAEPGLRRLARALGVAARFEAAHDRRLRHRFDGGEMEDVVLRAERRANWARAQLELAGSQRRPVLERVLLSAQQAGARIGREAEIRGGRIDAGRKMSGALAEAAERELAEAVRTREAEARLARLADAISALSEVRAVAGARARGMSETAWRHSARPLAVRRVDTWLTKLPKADGRAWSDVLAADPMKGAVRFDAVEHFLGRAEASGARELQAAARAALADPVAFERLRRAGRRREVEGLSEGLAAWPAGELPDAAAAADPERLARRLALMRREEFERLAARVASGARARPLIPLFEEVARDRGWTLARARRNDIER